MLGAKRDWFQPLTEGLGKAAHRLHLKPDHVTWAALIVSVAGAVLIATGHLIAGALVITVGASFDFIDGALARVSGQTSLAGGYLDSLLDRFVDFAVIFGVLLHFDETRYWIVGAIALFGSITTSFAKARVFQDLHPDASVWRRDILERTERYIILLPSIFFHGVLDASGIDFDLLWYGLLLLAVLSNLTVLQRMRTAMRLMREADRDG